MKIFVSALVVVAVAVAGCKNDFSAAGRGRGTSGDELIVRAHFIGSDRLLKDKEAARLKQVWNLKSSIALRDEALNHCARLPFLWLSNSLPGNAPEQAALFRAVWNDVLASESFLEWHATPAFSIATRLSEARAKLWDAYLRQAVTNWKLGNPVTVNAGGRSGWELSKLGAPPVRFTRAGDWVAVSVGQGAAALESNLLARTKSSEHANGAWLEGDANLAQFKNRLPGLERFENLPMAHFSLSNRADFVRTLVQFDFPKPHNWKAEPWQIPTNMIWDPLMDFTVVRGVAGALDGLPILHDIGWKTTPNQICGWGNRNLPFQLCYFAPMEDVHGQLQRMEPKIRAELVAPQGLNLLGTIGWDTNRVRLEWRSSGLPVAAPTAESVGIGAKEYLSLHFFPLIRTTQQPPRELFEQIAGRNDLVMYDWESTQYRLPTWRQFYQLAEISSRRALTQTNMPSQRWQLEVASSLGDAITELRATSPTEMTLVRKSTIGLTAFEMVTLSRWMESLDFPAFGVFPPQPPKRIPPRGKAVKPK